jgi:hypothetical protein
MTGEPPVPRIIPLAEPRPLSPGERELLDWLLTSPIAPDVLREQAAEAMVGGVCECGCPSVTFTFPDNVAAARLDPAHPNVRHAGDADIEAEATAPDGRTLDVILQSDSGAWMSWRSGRAPGATIRARNCRTSQR